MLNSLVCIFSKLVLKSRVSIINTLVNILSSMNHAQTGSGLCRWRENRKVTILAFIFARTGYIISKQVTNMLSVFLWKSLVSSNSLHIFMCAKYYCFKNIYVCMCKNIYNNFRIGEAKIQGEALIFEK